VEEGRKRSDAWPSTGGGGMGAALGITEAHVAKVFRAVVMAIHRERRAKEKKKKKKQKKNVKIGQTCPWKRNKKHEKRLAYGPNYQVIGPTSDVSGSRK
jgi:hypothetical protein